MKCTVCGATKVVKEHGIGCGKTVPVEVCPVCISVQVTVDLDRVAMGRIW